MVVLVDYSVSTRITKVVSTFYSSPTCLLTFKPNFTQKPPPSQPNEVCPVSSVMLSGPNHPFRPILKLGVISFLESQV